MLFGVSMALLVEARLGVMPWDVLHQGLARRTGLSLGTMTVIVGVAVLLCWIPLRERPGLGTVSNVLVIGVSVDAALALLPTPGPDRRPASRSSSAASSSTRSRPPCTSAPASAPARATGS